MSGPELDVLPLHPPFDVVYRGFHRRQVQEYLELLETQVKLASADRTEAVAQAIELRQILQITREDLEKTRGQLERLELAPSSATGASERVRRMMLLAEEETAELKSRTQREVSTLRKECQEEVRDKREAMERAAAELERRRVQLESDYEQRRAELELHHQQLQAKAEADYRAAMEQAQSDADRLLNEVASQCNQYELESDNRRMQAEQEFEDSMSRRRQQAVQDIAEREALSEKRCQLLMLVTTHEARRRINEVAQRTVEVERLRNQVNAQLDVVRSTVAQVAEHIAAQPPIDESIGDWCGSFDQPVYQLSERGTTHSIPHMRWNELEAPALADSENSNHNHGRAANTVDGYRS